MDGIPIKGRVWWPLMHWIKGYGILVGLILFNTLIFGAQSILPPSGEVRMIRTFGLSAVGLESGAWWEFLTHAFLHGNIWHLLVNMVSLWFAGRIVLEEIGAPKFLLLYVLAAIGGGVGQLLLGPPGVELIGASGAVFGVILALTTIFAEQQLMVLLFFVIPIRLKAKYLGYGLLAATVVMIIFNFEPWIGHAAHLGGAVTGLLFARALGYRRVRKIRAPAPPSGPHF